MGFLEPVELLVHAADFCHLAAVARLRALHRRLAVEETACLHEGGTKVPFKTYLTSALALPVAQYPWFSNCGLWTSGVCGLSCKDAANDS